MAENTISNSTEVEKVDVEEVQVLETNGSFKKCDENNVHDENIAVDVSLEQDPRKEHEEQSVVLESCLTDDLDEHLEVESSKDEHATQVEPRPHRRRRSSSQIPYHEVCRKRCLGLQRQYNAQFHNELKWLEVLQPNAHQAMRFHKHFSVTTLWPQLHTRRDIEKTMRQSYASLSRKEKLRLQELLPIR